MDDELEGADNDDVKLGVDVRVGVEVEIKENAEEDGDTVLKGVDNGLLEDPRKELDAEFEVMLGLGELELWLLVPQTCQYSVSKSQKSTGVRGR